MYIKTSICLFLIKSLARLMHGHIYCPCGIMFMHLITHHALISRKIPSFNIYIKIKKSFTEKKILSDLTHLTFKPGMSWYMWESIKMFTQCLLFLVLILHFNKQIALHMYHNLASWIWVDSERILILGGVLPLKMLC